MPRLVRRITSEGRLPQALAMVLLTPLALIGCGGGSTGDAGTSPASQATNAASACEPVPSGLLEAIAKGAEAGVGPMTLTRGRAYRSPDFSKVWFVAASLQAEGISPTDGVWATNSLEPGGGALMAVDGVAKEFTVWPDADSTAARISAADPAVAAAKNCSTG
jgi:hypothetical protein